MAKGAAGPAWVRLGQLLQDRRRDLGYGFRMRRAFLDDRAAELEQVEVHERIAAAVENAERADFDRSTLEDIEDVYGWTRGSVARVLAGGDPTPTEHARNLAEPTLRERMKALIDALPESRLDDVRRHLLSVLDEGEQASQD